jgi:hypothetical protein
LFFGGEKKVQEDGSVLEDFGISDEDLHRYQSYFKRDTEAMINMPDLMKKLPSNSAVDGKAPHLSKFPPCLVIGGIRDFIVDQEANDETAIYFGLDSPTMIDSPHDVMLGSNWRLAADVIHEFVQEKVET